MGEAAELHCRLRSARASPGCGGGEQALGLHVGVPEVARVWASGSAYNICISANACRRQEAYAWNEGSCAAGNHARLVEACGGVPVVPSMFEARGQWEAGGRGSPIHGGAAAHPRFEQYLQARLQRGRRGMGRCQCVLRRRPPCCRSHRRQRGPSAQCMHRVEKEQAGEGRDGKGCRKRGQLLRRLVCLIAVMPPHRSSSCAHAFEARQQVQRPTRFTSANGAFTKPRMNASIIKN